MIIRRKQMDALAAHARESFVRQMMAHLRGEFPQAVKDMPDPQLRAFVETGMDKARGHGVEQQQDVRRFLECRATLGADFDTDAETAWAAEILARQDLSGTAKMDRIIAYQLFHP